MSVPEPEANGVRRYGQWAGNLKGHTEDPARCAEDVTVGYRSHQCSRPRGHGPDGLYCKQHDPVRVKAENDRRTQEANKQHEARNVAWRLSQAAPAVLAAVRSIAQGHNDPRTLAIETLKACGLPLEESTP